MYCILLGGEIEALSELSVIPFCFTNIAKSTKILYLVELTQKLNFLVHRFIIFAFFSKFDKDSKIKKKEKLVLQRQNWKPKTFLIGTCTCTELKENSEIRKKYKKLNLVLIL